MHSRVFFHRSYGLQKRIKSYSPFLAGAWLYLSQLRLIVVPKKSGRSNYRTSKQRLDDNRWVVIFPEGTRVNPWDKKRFKMGGAILASNVDYPVVPVAHNAGEFWPRHSFIKYPGCISVCIGPVITAFGQPPEEIIKQVETWLKLRSKRFRMNRAGIADLNYCVAAH